MSKYATQNKALDHLRPSLFAENIYYADLFRLNDTIWMIAGCGKSKAAQIIVGSNRDNDLGRDAIAIKSEDGTMFGRYDPGAINPNLEELHRFYKIDYIAHCLTENQSKELRCYLGLTELSIMKVDRNLVAKFLVDYPYPGFTIKHFFDEEECKRLLNQKRRYCKFLEITEKSVNTKFVVVPWVNSLEEKAALYQKFLKK